MAIRFSFDAAAALTSRLTLVADMIESANADIRGRYAALSESFKDSKYLLYKASFDECDRTIVEACASLRELCAQMVRYAAAMEEGQ